MAVPEALARGLPVLAADVGGVTEALGHGEDGTRPGLLVPPGDPAALGAALRAWLRAAAPRGGRRPRSTSRRFWPGSRGARTAWPTSLRERRDERGECPGPRGVARPARAG